MRFLDKFLFTDLIKGLLTTFRQQDPREIVTEQYPAQRPPCRRAIPGRATAERRS